MIKQILSFSASASVTADACGINLIFTDGSHTQLTSLPPARFAAIVAVLQATKTAYYYWDEQKKSGYVGMNNDAPGP